jgi:hypothetical protein
MEYFEYLPVREESQLRQLYSLNMELAEREGQGGLFRAEYPRYREAFLGNCPAAQGWLILSETECTGFVIVLRKFASYLASVTAYIEDLYLRPGYADPKNYLQVLTAMRDSLQKEGADRVEIRVLEEGVLEPEILIEAGFFPVKKWRVWRTERVGGTSE